MQVTLIAFITLAVIYSARSAPSDEFMAKLKSAKEACKTSEPAKDEETFGNVWALRSLPSAESESCYIACLMKNFGALADGKFNVDALHVISENRWDAPEDIDKAEEVDEHCVKHVQTEGKDECTAVQELLKCFFEKSEEIGLKDKA